VRSFFDALSDAVEAIGDARRKLFAWLQSLDLEPIAGYFRSKTNWVQIVQYAGIVLAAPLSASDLEAWSTRAWLAASAFLLVLGILCRGRKEKAPSTPSLGDHASNYVSGIGSGPSTLT
jgi:hypothetical protein